MAISATFTAAILTISYLLLTAAARSSAAEDIHDLLPKYGLPRGLLPDAVKSYSLSTNGDFVVELTSECYVHFSYLVYYERRITGRVSYGQITDINGIQVKKLFLWVSLSSIVAKPDASEIEFKVGLLSQSLPAAEFETVHECRSKVAGCGDLDGIVAKVMTCLGNFDLKII